jgi:hypothetical protein
MPPRSLDVSSALGELAAEADAQLSVGELCPPRGERVVILDGQRFLFPYRVYYSPTTVAAVTEYPSTHNGTWLLCLASRHHDGRIREQAMRRLELRAGHWTIPFAVQLLGEYIVEIGQIIEVKLASFGAGPFARFVQENPEFMAVTRQRVISYWNCYYRSKYPSISDYPCYRALQAITCAAPSAA